MAKKMVVNPLPFPLLLLDDDSNVMPPIVADALNTLNNSMEEQFEEVNVAISDILKAEVVETIADRDELTTEKLFVYVNDATVDETVTDGAALYMRTSSTDSWKKIMETESMDLVIEHFITKDHIFVEGNGIERIVNNDNTITLKVTRDVQTTGTISNTTYDTTAQYFGAIEAGGYKDDSVIYGAIRTRDLPDGIVNAEIVIYRMKGGYTCYYAFMFSQDRTGIYFTKASPTLISTGNVTWERFLTTRDVPEVTIKREIDSDADVLIIQNCIEKPSINGSYDKINEDHYQRELDGIVYNIENDITESRWVISETEQGNKFLIGYGEYDPATPMDVTEIPFWNIDGIDDVVNIAIHIQPELNHYQASPNEIIIVLQPQYINLPANAKDGDMVTVVIKQLGAITTVGFESDEHTFEDGNTLKPIDVISTIRFVFNEVDKIWFTI